MAQADARNTTSPSRLHNFADKALTEALGYADAVPRGAQAEVAGLKSEFQRRRKQPAIIPSRSAVGSTPPRSKDSSATAITNSNGR
jgi:hypothetical protein